MIEKLGGRKFILTVMGVIALFVVVMVNRELAKDAMTALIALITGFNLSNAIKGGMEELNKK